MFYEHKTLSFINKIFIVEKVFGLHTVTTFIKTQRFDDQQLCRRLPGEVSRPTASTNSVFYPSLGAIIRLYALLDNH